MVKQSYIHGDYTGHKVCFFLYKLVQSCLSCLMHIWSVFRHFSSHFADNSHVQDAMDSVVTLSWEIPSQNLSSVWLQQYPQSSSMTTCPLFIVSVVKHDEQSTFMLLWVCNASTPYRKRNFLTCVSIPLDSVGGAAIMHYTWKKKKKKENVHIKGRELSLSCKVKNQHLCSTFKARNFSVSLWVYTGSK